VLNLSVHLRNKSHILGGNITLSVMLMIVFPSLTRSEIDFGSEKTFLRQRCDSLFFPYICCELHQLRLIRSHHFPFLFFFTQQSLLPQSEKDFRRRKEMLVLHGDSK
jgi:hypothetical protein